MYNYTINSLPGFNLIVYTCSNGRRHTYKLGTLKELYKTCNIICVVRSKIISLFSSKASSGEKTGLYLMEKQFFIIITASQVRVPS